jgi:NAD(P)-dependent dehydrogenase (short-subunit alcohol dehydrogenase family)
MNQNRVALVTGANRGIGLELCRQLAEAGFRTVLSSRDERLGAVAVQQLAVDGIEVLYCPMDVTKRFTVDRAMDFLLGACGRLDVLVNNAGALLDEAPAPGEVAALGITDATLLDSFQVNALGVYRVCRAAFPVMQRQGYGRIVNVTSGAGSLTRMTARHPAYRISKAAANAVTRVFADLAGDADIKVNSAAPGWVRTDMGGPDADRDVAAAAASMMPLAQLPADGPNGGFFLDSQTVPW